MDNFMTPRDSIRNALSASYMNVGKLLTAMKNSMLIDEKVKYSTFYKRVFNSKRGITADLWIDIMDTLGYDIVAVRRDTNVAEKIYSSGDFEL